MTLRSRLALLFGLGVLVSSGLVGVLAYRTAAAELGTTTDDFLRARLTEVSSGLRDRPGAGRVGRVTGASQIRGAADDDSIIQITGARGVVVSSGAVLPAPTIAGSGRENLAFERIEIDGEPYRMVTQVAPDGGAIQVARSVSEDERILSRLLARFAFIAAFVAAAAAAVGWYVAARTTSPLRRLAAVANDVAETRDFATDGILADGDRRDEIGSLATSFRSMLDALEASRAQQHRLINDAGHELRTPLTSLRANVELLERAPTLAPEQRLEVVTAIKSELLELTDLFDEMIDLATDQGAAPMAFVTFDLADVARDVAQRWGRRTGRVIEVDAKPSLVSGDPVMVERALSNLLSNADKFSPPGASIDVVAGDGAVCVRDRGPGVPHADRPLIFQRFHRSETTRSMPGSGLGLSIVAQIVERHGGDVWVSDAPSGGAEVGFTLRAADAPGQALGGAVTR